MTPIYKKVSSAGDDIPRTVAPRPMLPGLSYAVANLQGIGRREQQEDSFAFGHALGDEEVEKRGLFFVVADGMGGMADGRLASETVVKSLLSDYEGFDLQGDVPEQLASAVLKAGRQVFDKLAGRGGSTAVAALIHEKKLHFVSVGDSYAYLFRNRQLVRLNSSHNLLNEEYACTIRNGSLDPEEARNTQQGEALTQFLGMPGQHEIDRNIKALKLKAGDVILICSDGVAGVLSEDCISECLSYGLPMDMCQALEKEIQKANLRYQDNYTALVVQCRIK